MIFFFLFAVCYVVGCCAVAIGLRLKKGKRF